MGAWATSVQSSDDFKDIYDGFFKSYNEGDEPINIVNKIISAHQASFKNDLSFKHDAYFALAKALWECGFYDMEIFKTVEIIILEDSNIAEWKKLGAKEQDLAKRKLKLSQFLELLKLMNTKPKKRKKKRIVQPIFNMGDCLAVTLANGNYGGAIVLAANNDSEYGENLIACLNINQTLKPIVLDFKKAAISYHFYTKPSYGIQPLKLNVYLVLKKLLKSVENVEVIGNLPVILKITCSPHELHNSGLGSCGFHHDIFAYLRDCYTAVTKSTTK